MRFPEREYVEGEPKQVERAEPPTVSNALADASVSAQSLDLGADVVDDDFDQPQGRRRHVCR